MSRSAAAVYRTADTASVVHRRLIREGIAPNRIDVQPASLAHGLVPVVRSAAREGVVLGALFGVPIGVMIALAAVFAPDLAQSLDAGETSVAAGALGGGVAGALAGAFAGLFRSEPQRRRYADLLMKSGVVVSVDGLIPVELKMVTEVFALTRGVLLSVAHPRHRSVPRRAYG